MRDTFENLNRTLAKGLNYKPTFTTFFRHAESVAAKTYVKTDGWAFMDFVGECWLADMSLEELADSVREYIANMNPALA